MNFGGTDVSPYLYSVILGNNCLAVLSALGNFSGNPVIKI